MDNNLKTQFEQIFVKHHERLTNSRLSIGGLPLTMENIVCFILFGGRELDIEDIYGDVSERYSMETFMRDAKDAGIETDEVLYKAISDMVAQKFLHLQPDNHFYSYQATRETARQLNRIYPKMQGVNMLAYMGQTIQEVESGRVDLLSALSRFDQTLQKQGVPLPKAKIPVITPTPSRPSPVIQKRDERKQKESKIIRDYVVSSESVKAKIDKPPVVEDYIPEQALEASPEELSSANAPAATEAPKIEKVLPPAQPVFLQERKEEVVGDDEIAAKIAAFEKELALVCPLCKSNALKEEKTAGGKYFYSCTSATCNFISWGRPHDKPCPRCKNSFMVEVTDNDGKIILKCPRATCQYRQPLTPTTTTTTKTTASSPTAAGPTTGSVKKVVRKRLVRRKV